MTIGERIKEKRSEKKMSLDDLAKIAGVARQTIYKYENNIITNIPSDKIEAIANALLVTPAYLMGWEEQSDIFPVKFPEWYSFMQLSSSDSYNASFNLLDIVKEKYPDDIDILKLYSAFSQYLSNIDNIMNNYAVSEEQRIKVESNFPKAVVLFYDLNDDGRELATNYIDMLLNNDKYRRPQDEIHADDMRKELAFRFEKESINKNE